MRTVSGSHETSDYGFSVGRGAWTFESGRWMTLAIRVRLNDVGTQNGTSKSCIRGAFDIENFVFYLLGEIEVFVDGQSVLLIDGVVLCDDPSARICAIHFQTFFGGLSPRVLISDLHARIDAP